MLLAVGPQLLIADQHVLLQRALNSVLGRENRAAAVATTMPPPIPKDEGTRSRSNSCGQDAVDTRGRSNSYGRSTPSASLLVGC